METLDLGDGLQVNVSENEFDFQTDGNAHLVFTRPTSDSLWRMETDGRWWVTKKDVDQLIQCLQYVKEAMK